MKKWFLKIIDKLTKWFEKKHTFLYVEDIPENVKDKVVYIVGERKHPWLIIFKCPCGCNNLIQLNLLKEASPCWKFQISNKEKITIYPSIWRITGCKSHFFIRKSKIEWAWDYKV